MTGSVERRQLLAGLATERAMLLEQLVGLEEATLTELPVESGWTAKDLLAHIAHWDDFSAHRIELILAGEEQRIESMDPEKLDRRNAVVYEERRSWSLHQAVAACLDARVRFLACLARLSDDELNRVRDLPSGLAAIRTWAEWRRRHDAEHGSQLAAWRERVQHADQTSPKTVLLAALAGARDELLAVLACVHEEERSTAAVTGSWTPKDVLGHVADWDAFIVRSLATFASGGTIDTREGRDLDAWNARHCELRRDQSWEEIWEDAAKNRALLMDVVTSLQDADLGRRFASPWREKHTPADWIRIWIEHDREHAAFVRERSVHPAAAPEH